MVGDTRALRNSPMRFIEYFLQLVAGYWFTGVIMERLTTDLFLGLFLNASDWQYLFHNHIINRMFSLVNSKHWKQAIRSSLPIFSTQW